MEYINKVINIIGLKMLIAIVSIVLIVIVLFITYRLLKLKHYRKQIVDLENRINAIKSLPLQYRLGRVKGIAKNMPELQDKYELYEEQFSKLSDTLNDEITPLINEVDEALYYRKLHGVQKKMSKLENDVMHYETDSKQLLKDIEVITEIENIQRLEIIKVKEKYRETNDHYSQIRFKVEDYVPKLQDVFHGIDQQFVQLEDYMNNQQFEEAKQYTEKVSKDIDDLEANLRDLPTYISVTRQYLPKRLNELKTIMDEMMQKDFAVERMKATLRIDKIENDLNETAQAIKDLNLENVGQNIEVMTEDMNLLYADFEKEQNAYALYEEKRDACYKYVNTIDSGLSKTRDVIKDLEKNYILSDYEITIEDDYKEFQKVLDDLNDVTEIIESKDFSYQDMIENFERITINSKPFNDSLIKHNELAESLKIQEKRALDELDNINIVLLEIKSEIRNKHLPMISESYQDYIDDSYQKADAILNFIRQRPIDLKSLSMQVDAARDVIYKLYDNVHNLIVTAEMVEDAIIFGNRYRSSFLEVNTELTKAELLYRNGEYTKALSTAVDIIEKIKPDSYEMLVNKKSPKNA